jgi:UDP-3-O-[3-hydroxymyristoyl] glucosamine N-acyltransferase
MVDSRSYTLAELAELLRGDVAGDGATVISGVAGIKEAEPGDITFFADSKYADYLVSTSASALIRRAEVESSLPSIVVENPHLAFTRAINLLLPPEEPDCDDGVHETAIVDPTARLGDNVSVGPFCRVGPGAVVGSNTKIFFGAWIGRGAVIGCDGLIYPNVIIRELCRIGDRVVIHPGVVIGADGFGFAWDGDKHVKVRQVGIVVIEDDVEIGSNSTIDRATTGETRIGRGTKIDNLVQVGHNCLVGKHAILAGQAGLSGSTELGNHVIAGGQTGFVGHIKVGDGVQVAAKTGVTRSVKAGMTVLGFPAREFGLAKRIYACTARLPEIFKRVRELEEIVSRLAKGEVDDETAENDR